MKRLLLAVLLLLVAIPSVEAKRRETPEEIERKTRHYSGWEWGASARFGLVFYELDHMRITGESAVKAYQSQTKLGGNIMLNGGYLINNHWRVGLEAGAQIQYNHTVVPIYATAHYFYGKRKNCLFNFLNVGTNILFDKGARFGALGAGGVGFRFQGPEKNHKIDIMVGYQAIMMTPRPYLNGSYSFNAKDVRLQEVNQSVFIGIGVAF